LQEPNSLIGRIYKEKYYCNGTLLSSELGRRPSYAWRSIWNAKKLLQEGLVWRVGDGRSIKIWKDRWLEKPSTFLVQSPVQILNEEATVSELIIGDTKMCNTSMVSEVFMEDEAKHICQMVVSPLAQRDRLVWMGNKNGHYTVRSGYHFAMEGVDREEGCTSDSSGLSQLWQKVWNFRGPRALKMFLWRACNNILPTKENLYKRKIVDNPQCDICGADTETVGHILWSCVAAKDVWLENMKPIQKSTSAEIDFQHLFVQLFDRLVGKDFQRFGFVARQLWFRRNKVIFDDEFLSPARVNQTATTQLEDFNLAEVTQAQTREAITTVGVPRITRWKKPKVGVVKINWDATISTLEDMMGVGVMARDNTGFGSIPTWEFRHVRHEGNCAAHRLAHQSFVFRDTRVWLGPQPSCIQDVLNVESRSSV
jgi:hypothetical protein